MALADPLSTAVIITVGSELLTPDRTDTNSLFLTRELNELGVSVRYKMIVGDERDDLAHALRTAIPQADLVVLTGGLGATADDITRETVASVFDLPLQEDAGVVSALRSGFAARGLEMPDINRRQALIPEGAVALGNDHGTAPGLFLEHEGTLCVVLPGPPRELHPMFREVAAVRLAPHSGGRGIFRRVLIVAGRTESHVEEAAQPVYSRWRARSPAVHTSILASLGQIELHLSTASTGAAEAARVLTAATAELAEVLGTNLVSTDGSPLEGVVGRLLMQRESAVAVAESCTGGLIASRLTDIPGSSAYVHSGWVVYSNEAKTQLLGVDPQLIADHGAVSEPVAEALAVGARQRAGVEYALGVTGIAGPGGGSTDKPVGTVYIALVSPNAVPRVRRLRLPGERERVKYQASQAALDMLRRVLLQ